MTVSSTTTRRSASGDGSNDTFSYNFKIFSDDDITVVIRTDSTGAETTKTKTTHYTVTGVGSSSGGNVVFTSGNIPASGETVVLLRTTARTQLTDYVANDPFPAATHEDALDKLTFIVQELEEEIGRSLKLSQTNTIATAEFTVGATDRANKILGFDTSGDLAIFQEIGTFKGTDATITTAAYVERDIVKSTTTAQLNNVYIALQNSPIGTALTNTTYWALLVDAVSAATSATNAATSATNAASSATAAATSETNAATSATNAATTLTTFQNQYHGASSSDPTSNLDAGDLYFNTSDGAMRVYNGSAFINVVSALGNLANVVEDSTPQLGGNLDTNGNDIVTVSNANLDLAPNGTGAVVVRGNTNPGTVIFNCEANTHGQTVKAQPHSATVTNTLTLPAGGNQEIVGTTATQTLTNKSIDGAQLTGSVATARLDTGTSANQIVTLDSSAKLPAVDGSQLTNITVTETDPSALAFAIALG